jgi:hypothetical protein
MSKRTPFYGHLFAGLLVLGILALLTSTAWLVVASLTHTTNPATSSSALPSTATSFDETTILTQYLANHQKLNKSLKQALLQPYVTFIGDTLAPSDNKLTGTLEVVVPPGVPPQMTNSSGKAMFDNNNNPLPQFANQTIDAGILVTDAGGNFETQESIKLKDLYTGTQLGVHDFPIVIPVKGYAGNYPQDVYSADISLTLAFPSKQQFQTGTYALVRSVQAGTLTNTYAVTIKPSPPKYQRLISTFADDTFALSIGRNPYNTFFVYAVALIPTLFAFLFMHLLFFSSGAQGLGKSFEHFTEALVLSVLSVLPLRVVLVPGDISGLTRVDLLLAVGLVLIVTVAAGKYAAEIWWVAESREAVVEAPHDPVLAPVTHE